MKHDFKDIYWKKSHTQDFLERRKSAAVASVIHEKVCSGISSDVRSSTPGRIRFTKRSEIAASGYTFERD